jgi:ubiquitin carboxyl-terminal hydrolase 7
VFFFSQQQQQEEEEVLVPHGPQQELPNGAQPMEGLVGHLL